LSRITRIPDIAHFLSQGREVELGGQDIWVFGTHDPFKYRQQGGELFTGSMCITGSKCPFVNGQVRVAAGGQVKVPVPAPRF
jgi:hypothetical protein